MNENEINHNQIIQKLIQELMKNFEEAVIYLNSYENYYWERDLNGLNKAFNASDFKLICCKNLSLKVITPCMIISQRLVITKSSNTKFYFRNATMDTSENED